tara:strand:- start:278 stop:1036 length:759 start_codon:yes stop_codon:yes gene_type:complete
VQSLKIKYFLNPREEQLCFCREFGKTREMGPHWKYSSQRCIWSVSTATLFTAIVVLSSEASAAAAWEVREKAAGIVVFSQDEPGSGAAKLRGIINLDFSVEEVAKVLTDIPNQVHFVPNCKTSQLLEKEVLANGRVYTLVYQVNAVPVVSDRDMLLEATTWPEGEGRTRVWRSDFKAVSREKPKVPDGVVRIENLYGDWHLEAGPRGKGSVLTYTNHAELGGILPHFVIDSVRAKNMLNLLLALRKRCEELY